MFTATHQNDPSAALGAPKMASAMHFMFQPDDLTDSCGHMAEGGEEEGPVRCGKKFGFFNPRVKQQRTR